jgi:hypothetical protein
VNANTATNVTATGGAAGSPGTFGTGNSAANGAAGGNSTAGRDGFVLVEKVAS